MRCLLDKVIARYTVQGLIKLDRGQTLTVEEVFSLDLLQQGHQTNTYLYVSPPSANVLQKVATFDQPMINNWNVNVVTIRMRLF